GQPSHGATHQGNSDHSVWARGQSWAILGIPLNESYLHTQPFPQNYGQIVDVFLAQLPADLVPYWDFDFNDQTPSDKDSSALAIAACGLLEAAKMQAFPDAQLLAKGMIYQLGEHYAASQV
ncbi:glycoside hydrolase family 88 protein, partial [Enterobacter bugandensis]|nr:glycoside hydrolase family 88 protein [Enterobacter bugandensis]